MDKLSEIDLYVWTNLSEFDQYGKNQLNLTNMANIVNLSP